MPVEQPSKELKHEGMVPVEVKKAGELLTAEVWADSVASEEMTASSCRRRSSCDLSDHCFGLVDSEEGRRTKVVSILPDAASFVSFEILSIKLLRILESCEKSV